MDKILQEIEEENLLKKTEHYKNYVYKPERLTLSSYNATYTDYPYSPYINNSFYNFTIDLPRPLLNVKSLQLLRASIPQCSQNIADTSLVLYYYRLQTQLDINGDTYFTNPPSIDNLYCIRLLPSYYKPELIDTPQQYGFNQTFNSYDELLTQLNLSTQNDLAYNNQVVKTFPFIPNDITFSLLNNKFQVTGNNVNTPPIYQSWDPSITYHINDIVDYLGTLYIATTTNQNINPTTIFLPPAPWITYSQTNNYNTYLLAGFNDPNVLALQKIINQQSQVWDFELLTSIPGQPYQEKKTLNLVLGFTWDGNNFALDQLVTPTSYTQGSSAPVLLNRLRPIPVYSQTLLLGAFPQTTTGTYTADAYCNLVFSSFISIYTTIVGASTLDSQRNTNLLSIVPMNCPNLGVTFYNNVIDTELTKVNSDIYSIYIELRKEDQSPFYISNNGIITLDLKLTY